MTAQTATHVTQALGHGIAPTQGRVVAARTGNGARSGQARVEEQHLAQRHFIGRHGVVARYWEFGRAAVVREQGVGGLTTGLRARGVAECQGGD